ncbi:outer membrane lipopolysaccharide assembly protein LptE/RlpB [Pontibacter aydingkolensis]|nr:Ig-like domain-containing protein [Pontibacter aydingkolensis]
MKLKTMLASLAAICMLTACEDLFEDGSMQADGSKPSLTINNPSNNQSISTTQGLRVNVTVVDKDLVKDLQFTVKGVNSETALVTFSKFPERNVVEFDTTIALNNVSPGEYKLQVAATDKRTNLEQKEVLFTVK